MSVKGSQRGIEYFSNYCHATFFSFIKFKWVFYAILIVTLCFGNLSMIRLNNIEYIYLCFIIHTGFIMLNIYSSLVVNSGNYFCLHFSNCYLWFCVADSVQLRLCVSYWIDNNAYMDLFSFLLNSYIFTMICYYYYLVQYFPYFICIIYYLFTHYYLILTCYCHTYYVFTFGFG